MPVGSLRVFVSEFTTEIMLVVCNVRIGGNLVITGDHWDQ